MPAFDTIQDDFETGLDTTRWPDSGAVTIAGGRAHIPATNGYPSLATGNTYTLLNTSIHAEVTPAPLGDSGADAYSKFHLEHTTGGTQLVFEHKPATGEIIFGNYTGWWENERPTTTYDPAAMRWLRFRETAGSVYWETSPDGVTWTARRSLPTPAWVGEGTTKAVFETYRNTGTMGAEHLEVDNVNTTPTTDTAPAPVDSLLLPDGTWQNVRWQLIT